jgi:hypothetical protein
LNMVDGEVCRERISTHDAARRTCIASKPCSRDKKTCGQRPKHPRPMNGDARSKASSTALATAQHRQEHRAQPRATWASWAMVRGQIDAMGEIRTRTAAHRRAAENGWARQQSWASATRKRKAERRATRRLDWGGKSKRKSGRGRAMQGYEQG